LESYCSTKEGSAASPSAEVRVLDGAAVERKTSCLYVNPELFVPYVTSELERSSRVDFVWDVCLKDSLKMTARENRGTGARRRVLSNVKLPSY